MKPVHIHFVCRGNTFRSRLAAAYMSTLVDSGFTVSSSGVDTAHAPVRTVKSYTSRLAHKHNLKYQLTTPKVQTDDQLLASADVIVFMAKDVYDSAVQE
ncbi:MAG TPA: hypothetical protein VFH39_00845, partial [Candidatus Saccharimonadales bacterium]|nr:hypothetical protein [Candidatus Saccharimonadales bacterium]